jgi:hypothetical protein
VVGRFLQPSKGIFVRFQQLTLLGIDEQNLAATHEIVLVIGGNSLPPGHFQHAHQYVFRSLGDW